MPDGNRLGHARLMTHFDLHQNIITRVKVYNDEDRILVSDTETAVQLGP